VTVATTMKRVTTEGGLERVRFFPGQVLTADDMSQSTEWARRKLRRHNRFLHGWGIVCGCDVRAPAQADKPWEVRICSGYLLTPQGDEIYIAADARFDLAACLLESDDPCAYARPCPPLARKIDSTRRVLYLAVRYDECNAQLVRMAPVGCACDEAQCDYARTREGYEFSCLDKAPVATPTYGCEHLCAGDVVGCADCPDDPWVLLATINLPENEDIKLTARNIHLEGRPLLYSTRMLQEMAMCACGHEVRPTPTPTPTPTPIPTPKLNPPELKPAPDFYPNDVDVTMWAQPGAEIRYTTNGTEPNAGSTLYTAPVHVPFNPGVPVTVKARAFRVGWIPSDVAGGVYDWIVIG
jgi:Chitobiase/beta-hexosaminidase C-terminal domain